MYVLENHKHLMEEEIIYSNKKDAGRTYMVKWALKRESSLYIGWKWDGG